MVEQVLMDRKIEKKAWTWKKLIYLFLGAFFLLLSVYGIIISSGAQAYKVEENELIISTVKRAGFLEYIPVSGIVTPSKSIYIDATEAGIIKNIFKESGAIVKAGDVILELANSNLSLDVLHRESQLYEQINLMRNTRLALDQNNLNQKAQLTEIEYQLNILKPQFDRYKQLLEKKMVSEREYELVKEQYDFNQKRKKIMTISYLKDSISRNNQLDQLEASEIRISKNLVAVQKILENLTIKSIFNGQLSTSDLQVGQSIKLGERLGQIDLVGEYKIKLPIDELYLSQVFIGQRGSFEYSGQMYDLSISKIYPNINKGKFEVDMLFLGNVPNGLRRGLTITVKLELGEPAQVLVIPTGSFFKTTGGNWIFVLDKDKEIATRRNIKLGRKNPTSYEVLEGLKEGEKVITSSYDTFAENEMLKLTKYD